MAAGKTGQLRVGTSGYQYDHWRERFYPKGLAKKDWFDFYAEHFDTVEINNTFYNLPKETTFDAWYEQAPAGFQYALKFSRYGTHMKKLKDPQQSIDMFVQRAARLKKTLGPILVQLPPGWGVDVERLDSFLGAASRKYQWVVELRDRSWLCDEVREVLRRHKAATCVHDMMEDHPWWVTADFLYVRFHGTTEGRKYTGHYSPQALSAQAGRISDALGEGYDVYAYFNNDEQAFAVTNAPQLRRYVETRQR